MGKKYFIELLDDCPSEFKGIIVFGLTPEGQIAAEPIPVEDLTPYTEPDLEQVRKEAFEEGKKQAKVQAELDVCHDIEKVAKGNYNTGLADAWECMNRILDMSCEQREQIFSKCKAVGVWDLLHEYSASEAIEKIRQCEQIQVGDEVITASGKAVVMGVGPVHFEYVYADGSHGYDEVKNVKKTGRHFHQIAEVLEKMKGVE